MPLSYSLEIRIIINGAAHALLFLASNWCDRNSHTHTLAVSRDLHKKTCAEENEVALFPYSGVCLFTFLIYALAARGDVIATQSATHKASFYPASSIFILRLARLHLQLTECGCVMRELKCKMQLQELQRQVFISPAPQTDYLIHLIALPGALGRENTTRLFFRDLCWMHKCI